MTYAEERQCFYRCIQDKLGSRIRLYIVPDTYDT